MRDSGLLTKSLVTLSAMCLIAPALSARSVLYVLDDKEDSITAISREGETLGEVEIAGEPERIAISPNGDYLIALDKGKGWQYDVRGFVPEKKSTISVIKSQTLEAVSLEKICWSVSVGGVERGIGIGGAWYFSEDGNRIVILCEATPLVKYGPTLKDNKSGLAELLDIDLETGTVARRVDIDRPVTGWINMPDGEGFAIFVPFREMRGKNADQKAEIRFIDGQTLQGDDVLQIDGKPGPPFISADQTYLILLDPGDHRKGAKSKVPGVLHVVSVAERKLLRSIDLGAAPRIRADIANSQLIVASYLGPNSLDKDRDTGIVRLIKFGQLTATFEVGRNPIYVQSFPEHNRLYTVGAKEFTITNTATGVSRQIKYKPKMTSFGEMVVTSDQTRAFLLAARAKMGFDLLVIDLDTSSIANFFGVGSGGKKFGKVAGSTVLAFGLSSLATSMMPGQNSLGDIGSTVVRDMTVQTIIQALVLEGALAGAYSDIAFGPGEKYLYAINQFSRDVTVFDAVTLGKGTAIKDSGGARRIRLLPESGLLAVLAGDEKLILIDTATHTVVEERKFGGNFMFLGDGEDAIALSRKTHSVYLLDGSTLDVIRSAGDIKNPYQYVLNPD
jgi:hypothetical protein